MRQHPVASAAPRGHGDPLPTLGHCPMPGLCPPPCIPTAVAAAPFWLTDTSGDPHRDIGARLTLKEPVDEGAREWGILQKTRRC